MNDYKELCERPQLCWAYIDELRAAIAQLAKYVKKCEVECEAAERCINQLVRERDAAVADLQDKANCCNCKYLTSDGYCVKNWCLQGEVYEWRGVQNERL